MKWVGNHETNPTVTLKMLWSAFVHVVASSQKPSHEGWAFGFEEWLRRYCMTACVTWLPRGMETSAVGRFLDGELVFGGEWPGEDLRTAPRGALGDDGFPGGLEDRP